MGQNDIPRRRLHCLFRKAVGPYRRLPTVHRGQPRTDGFSKPSHADKARGDGSNLDTTEVLGTSVAHAAEFSKTVALRQPADSASPDASPDKAQKRPLDRGPAIPLESGAAPLSLCLGRSFPMPVSGVGKYSATRGQRQRDRDAGEAGWPRLTPSARASKTLEAPLAELDDGAVEPCRVYVDIAGAKRLAVELDAALGKQPAHLRA